MIDGRIVRLETPDVRKPLGDRVNFFIAFEQQSCGIPCSGHERISFGEEASLANRVTMINVALVVAYHAR